MFPCKIRPGYHHWILNLWNNVRSISSSSIPGFVEPFLFAMVYIISSCYQERETFLADAQCPVPVQYRGDFFSLEQGTETNTLINDDSLTTETFQGNCVDVKIDNATYDAAGNHDSKILFYSRWVGPKFPKGWIWHLVSRSNHWHTVHTSSTVTFCVNSFLHCVQVLDVTPPCKPNIIADGGGGWPLSCRIGNLFGPNQTQLDLKIHKNFSLFPGLAVATCAGTFTSGRQMFCNSKNVSWSSIDSRCIQSTIATHFDKFLFPVLQRPVWRGRMTSPEGGPPWITCARTFCLRPLFSHSSVSILHEPRALCSSTNANCIWSVSDFILSNIFRSEDLPPTSPPWVLLALDGRTAGSKDLAFTIYILCFIWTKEKKTKNKDGKGAKKYLV